MAYHTLLFLCVFLPLVLILYQIFPQKYRPMVLLAAGYVLFFSFSRFLFIYLLAATVVSYAVGRIIEKIQLDFKTKKKELDRESAKALKKVYTGKKKRVLVIGILLLLGTLIGVKYYNFFAENVVHLLKILSVPVEFKTAKILQPIGISYYTLEAVGYIVDVYEGKIKAEHKFTKLALFLSFFPQIMEGPLARYEQTADMLYAGENLKMHHISNGTLRIFWGLFKKMLVADRLNWVVDTVYRQYYMYDGIFIALGAVAYTVQLYMEFSGCIDIIIGIGELFGIQLPENFRQPFFSRSVSEFWRRWHITLGAWLKDYIFYPVSLSNPVKRAGNAVKNKFGKHGSKIVISAMALFPVWLCNGLWHGPKWIYVFFGMYYFVLIMAGIIFEPVFTWMKKPFPNIDKNPLFIGFQMLRTTVLVVIGEMFFRSNDVGQAMELLKKLIFEFHMKPEDSEWILYLGIDKMDFVLILIAVLVVFVVGCLHERGIQIRERVAAMALPVRWCIYYALIFSVILFGAYGDGYTAVDLIYAGF